MDGRFTNGWVGMKHCKECGQEFLSTSGSRRFCDSCIALKTVCPVCGGKKSLYDRFCGNACAGKNKYRVSAKVRAALLSGIYVPQRGVAISRALLGKPRFDMRGENSPNWSGGIYRYGRHVDMGRVEYKEWRRKIFTRDNFTCQNCGIRGGRLNAHHVASWVDYPDKRYDVDNGITLCVECHKKVRRERFKEDCYAVFK